MDKLDLIDSIKKNYKAVQAMKIENAQAFAVNIRSFVAGICCKIVLAGKVRENSCMDKFKWA